MCECGCGDGQPLYQFPGPKGSVYVLSFYSGCENCDSPIGIIIQKYKNIGQLEDRGVDGMKSLTFYDTDIQEAVLPIIWPSKVISRISDMFGDIIIKLEDEDDKEDPFTIKELLEDVERTDCCQAVMEAAQETVDTFMKGGEKTNDLSK